ncbi:uncharacterized protein LOC111711323 [Eurytemora carolleeae]|uniref:uncharacterized protein LOC111711323 n=1 Tax=Eurytemora carolleeae TaxID=1294199 RepID=UPI000C7588BF|nr:uncharacterized protein LOC111711323 [Eurytemora carolleeae]|eukprot:XP_023341424.1 uncharacterized protein LOC111711323 [Eurytemora affinis]
MKKTCEICNEEVPYSSISVHKRKVHGIGKPMDDITPRGPNLKLRKRYRQMIENELEFDRLAETTGTGYIKGDGDDDEEMMDEEMEEMEEEGEEEEEELGEDGTEMGTKTIQVQFKS